MVDEDEEQSQYLLGYEHGRCSVASFWPIGITLLILGFLIGGFLTYIFFYIYFAS